MASITPPVGFRRAASCGAGAIPHSEYEERFSAFLGENVHAFAVWKGRVALYAILKALGIGQGDEVILPGFTCVVVPNAVRLAGARPVYADISSDSYNVDLGEVARSITPRTRAIILQHTFGIPACTDEGKALAHSSGLFLLEDCAHVLGTRLDGLHLGLRGHAAFFSSQWSKPFTTGLGGLAVTRDPEIALHLQRVLEGFRQPPSVARARLFVQYQLYTRLFSPRLYWSAQSILQRLGRLGLFVGSSSTEELEGIPPRDHEWRMPSYQKKIGLSKLSRFTQALNARNDLSRLYDLRLAAAGWPVVQRSAKAALLRYPVRVANKSELLEKARKARVELGSWFETPLHPISLEQHKAFNFSFGQCPNSEKAAREVVNLPLHDRITQAEAERTISFFLANARPAA